MKSSTGKTIGEALLEIAANTADGCIQTALDFLEPSITKQHYYNKNIAKITRQNIHAAKKRLMENGCLEKIENKGGTYYRITLRGRKKIEKLLFDQEKWDGQWRIVMFDIEETERRKRNFLRRKLKEMGFKQLQKSVWVSPFDVIEEVRELVNDNNLHQNFWYFWANSVTNDEEIIEKFLKEQN